MQHQSEAEYEEAGRLCRLTCRGDLRQLRLVATSGNCNLRGRRGFTPLMWASVKDSPDAAAHLLALGADPTTPTDYERTSLHLAALNGSVEVARLLIAAGVGVDQTSRSGETPLMLAVWNGHLEMMRALLANGADVDRRDIRELTPLGVAELRSNTAAADLLQDWKQTDSREMQTRLLSEERRMTAARQVLAEARCRVLRL